MSQPAIQILGAEISAIERDNPALGRVLRRLADAATEAAPAGASDNEIGPYPAKPGQRLYVNAAAVLSTGVLELLDSSGSFQGDNTIGLISRQTSMGFYLQIAGRTKAALVAGSSSIRPGQMLWGCAQAGKASPAWPGGAAHIYPIGFAIARPSSDSRVDVVIATGAPMRAAYIPADGVPQ